MQTLASSQKWLTVWSDEIRDRLDVSYFYTSNKADAFLSEKHSLVSLGEVCELIDSGNTPPKDAYFGSADDDKNGSAAIIKVAGASGRTVNLSKVAYYRPTRAPKKSVNIGDIFILAAAHQPEYVGKNVSILVDEPKVKTSFVGELIRIRTNKAKYLPELLHHILSSKKGYALLNREKRGQTSHLYPSDISKIQIPDIDIDLQKQLVSRLRISGYFDKVNNETADREINRYLAKELGITIPEKTEAKKWFTIWSDEVDHRIDSGPYHPDRMNAIKAIEASKYPQSKLSSLVDFQRTQVRQLDGKRYLGLENVESNTGREIETSQDKISISSATVFAKGDILFAKLRPYLNKVHLADSSGACSTEFHVIRCKDTVIPAYMRAFLASELVVRQTSHLMTGNTLPRLQTEDVYRIQVPVPDLPTQQKIVTEIERIENGVKEARWQREKQKQETLAEMEKLIFG
jgi:restriction endonuclease S subunit